QVPAVIALDDIAAAERVTHGRSRDAEADVVFENVRLAAVDALFEKEIVVVQEPDAIEQDFAVAVAVVGESIPAGVLKRLVERDAVHHEVRAFGTAARAVAAELEAIAVAAERTGRREKILVAVVPRPAIRNHNRVVRLEEIPAVVGILPRPAAAKHIAHAGMQLARETIRVAAARRGIVV